MSKQKINDDEAAIRFEIAGPSNNICNMCNRDQLETLYLSICDMLNKPFQRMNFSLKKTANKIENNFQKYKMQNEKQYPVINEQVDACRKQSFKGLTSILRYKTFREFQIIAK